MKKTKIITSILFVGITTGWILLANEGPDSDEKKKRDKARPEREVQRDKPLRDGDRAREDRDKPRREGERERERPRREGERERGDGDREKPRREGERERERPHPEGDRDREKPRREGDRERERPHIDGERERHERAHGQNELEQWAQQQERRIHELREAGHNEEAERVMENLKRTMAQHGRNNERGHGPVDERVRHMMAAIEHLRAVGMHDLAEQVEARAHGLHREREDHEDRGHEREAHEHEHHDEGNVNLRQEVEELKRAIRAIQNHLEKRER